MANQLQHILYVDDEDDIREVAKMSLEIIGGLTVTDFNNGKEAILKAESINPDIILLDVMMPIMDGPTTLKILRKNPALDNIPVIIMTARVQASEIDEYIQLGAAGVINKPFDPMKLASQVTEIWEKFHAR